MEANFTHEHHSLSYLHCTTRTSHVLLKKHGKDNLVYQLLYKVWPFQGCGRFSIFTTVPVTMGFVSMDVQICFGVDDKI